MANMYKRLTKDLIRKICSENGNDTVQFYEFDKKHTMCLISSCNVKTYGLAAYFVGFAACSDSDEFDKWYGRYLALSRLENTVFTVHKDILNAIYNGMDNENTISTEFDAEGKKV